MPIELAPAPISMTWQKRDPEMLWLREKVLEILNNRLDHFH